MSLLINNGLKLSIINFVHLSLLNLFISSGIDKQKRYPPSIPKCKQKLVNKS